MQKCFDKLRKYLQMLHVNIWERVYWTFLLGFIYVSMHIEGWTSLEQETSMF